MDLNQLIGVALPIGCYIIWLVLLHPGNQMFGVALPIGCYIIWLVSLHPGNQMSAVVKWFSRSDI